MASFTGGNTSNLHLVVDWSVTSQSVVNNTSTIKVTVSANYGYSYYWNGTWRDVKASVTGGGSTQSSNVGAFSSRSGKRQLGSFNFTVKHDSDGTKTTTIRAEFPFNLTTTTYIGTVVASKEVTLPQIAQATTVSQASAVDKLAPGEQCKISVTTSHKSSSLSATYQIFAGSTRISNTTGQTSSRSSLTLTTSMVDAILDTMSSVKSRTLQLRILTYSGSTQVGSTQTKNFTISIDETACAPEITGTRAEVRGNGSSGVTAYLQNVSQVYGYFTSVTARGATRVARSVSVDGKVIANTYYGTSPVIKKSGTIKVEYYVKDSRGLETTTSRNVTFQAYSPPKITRFDITRLNPATNVRVYRQASYTNLSGNSLSGYIQVKKPGAADSTYKHYVNTNSFTGSYTDTVDSETESFTFRWTVSDSFNTTRAEFTLSTAAVLMDLWEDKGVGIGKYWERGALDVGGDVSVDGDVTSGGVLRSTFGSHVGSLTTLSSGLVAVDSSAGNDISIRANTFGSGNVRLLGNDILVNTNATSGDTSIIESGSNSNGDFIKFYDGTMICWGTGSSRTTSVAYGALYRSTTVWLYYAQTFTSTPRTVIVDAIGQSMMGGTNSVQASRCSAYIMSPVSGDSATLRYLAIGKWR